MHCYSGALLSGIIGYNTQWFKIFANGTAHMVWGSLTANPREVEMASVKARLLTGTYVLQANRARFNQYEVNPTCTICKEEPENRLHFILRCKQLDDNRRYQLNRIKQLLHDIYSPDIADAIIEDQNILLQVILDCSHPSLQGLADNPPLESLGTEIEPMSRSLCYGLHLRRAALYMESTSVTST